MTTLPVRPGAGLDAGARSLDLVLDETSSIVRFTVRWLGVLRVHGEFPGARAAIHLMQRSEAAGATVQAVMSAHAVRTGIALRDRHLASAHFLDAARHPQIVFSGVASQETAKGFEISGSLTIRGVTHPVTLRCRRAPAGSQSLPLTVVAETEVSRRAFGVGNPGGLGRFNPALLAIGDRVSVRITALLVEPERESRD